MICLLAMLSTEEEQNSFRKVYEANYRSMYHVVLGMLKNQQDAENVVHDAFLVLVENYEKYMGLSDREMTGLCITLAKNKALDLLRKQKFLTDQELDEIVLYEKNVDLLPEEHAEQTETEDTVQKALKSLPEVFKQTLVLKYYYQLDNGEIARLLDTSKKVVEMRLYRGKEKLKEVLNGEE